MPPLRRMLHRAMRYSAPARAAGLPPPFFIRHFDAARFSALPFRRRAAAAPADMRAAPRCCRRQRCRLLRACFDFSPIAADTPMLSATTPCRDARFRRYAASAAAAIALPPCRRERQRRRYFCRHEVRALHLRMRHDDAQRRCRCFRRRYAARVRRFSLRFLRRFSI
jgi:hypothetical protein